jgi:cysteine synthase A
MSNIYTAAEQLIGRTPMVRLLRMEAAHNLNCRLLVKLESANPGGSAKDRVARAMLDDAEDRGLITSGATIIEPTSGNTGIGLAAVCAQRGYRCIIVMPDTMSQERQKLMTAYGAELVLTPGSGGMLASIAKAKALAASIPGAWIPDQFSNPANAAAHYMTTAPEIWADTDGDVDIFVSGVGTGGTITGVGRFLRERNPQVQIIAVEPKASPLLSAGKAGSHGIQGIGANFVPDLLDTDVYSEVLPVTEDAAFAAARELGKTEGLLCGISSGAALHAALELAQKPENEGKTIVVLLPDTGERYLSTAMFQ